MHRNPGLKQIVCLIGLAWMVSLLTPSALFAAPPFPRGPGLYFDPYKLGAMAISFLAWVKLCAWVDLDAHRHRIDGIFWNSLLLVGGVAGFLLIWGLGSFWIAIFLFWLFVGAPAYWYLTK